jgi:cytochrome c
MRSCNRSIAIGAAWVAVALVNQAVARDGERLGIGHPVTEAELAPWNIDVAPDGSGLPAGRGSVQQGKSLYDAKCAACHGPEGQGSPMSRLAGGRGTLTSPNPVKTIGSYWPYATTVFDYVRRAMPPGEAQSLSADETYALTAYLLALNDIIGPDTVMDAQSLPRVQMPNQSAFGTDPRPDVSNSGCSDNCTGAASDGASENVN